MNASLTNTLRCLAVGLVATASGLTARALTPDEANGILFMKQEEKLARDVYQALAARWNHATFQNIARSEQQHMDAIDTLIDRNGLTDTTPEETGRFSIPELQALHDQLLVQGEQSLDEALKVGARVEETDIVDLKESLAIARDATLQRVFSNLLRASGRHLAAFQTALGLMPSTDAVGATSCPRGGTCATSASCVGASTQAGKGATPRRGGQAGRTSGGPGSATATCTGTCPQETCPAQNPATALPAPRTTQTRRGGQ